MSTMDVRSEKNIGLRPLRPKSLDQILHEQLIAEFIVCCFVFILRLVQFKLDSCYELIDQEGREEREGKAGER